MNGLRTQNRTINSAKSKLLNTIIRVIVIVVIIFIAWAQNNLVLTREYIYSGTDVPKAFVGYKILHISDICNTSNNVVRAAKKADPDIILLTGGYQDKNGKYNKTVKTVEKLCKIAPVYYIYNTNDTVDCLADTQAVNITDNKVSLSPKTLDAETFIKEVYGSGIVRKANSGNEEALQYMQYISDELASSQYLQIDICGINNMNDWSFNEIQKLSYEITGGEGSNFTVMLNGNLANLDSLCDTNIDVLLVGGTFGKSSEIASCSKGPYSYLGVQLFVSGGCGNLNNIRICNLPEIQLITLSDGTIEKNNPLENFIDLFIDDVGTIYDNDGGFSDYTYKYGLGA